MDASAAEHDEAEHAEDTSEPGVVGTESTFDDVGQGKSDEGSQEPLGAEDSHGSVTPQSAQPAEFQSGHVTPDPGQGDQGAAQGEAGGDVQGPVHAE